MKILGLNIPFTNKIPGEEVKGTTGRSRRISKDINNDISLHRTKQDIAKWRSALQAAENKSFPNRTEYYRLLKDVIIDAHLSSCIMQRKNAILCRDFKVLVNGEYSEEKTKALKTDWFYRILNSILDAEYYGFTLLDIGPYNNGFNDIVTVERQYVKPELGIVANIPSANYGVAIDDPAYKKWSLFFCKDAFDLGLLMKAAPLVLWKKNAMGYWSEHAEKFGQPMRIGRTDTTDDALLANMEANMRNMGSSFWGVFDKADEFELLTGNTTSNHELYDMMIERCNSELSKLILGQTGTTDEKSFVGSAQVHKNVLSEIVEADDKYVTSEINKNVIPLLNMHGLGFENCTFEFNYAESLSLKDKAEVDAKFMPYVKFNKEYLEQTYGIVLDDDDSDSEEGDEPKKLLTNLHDTIRNSYAQVCKCGGSHDYENKIFFTEEEINKIIENVWAGVYTILSLPKWLYEETANYIYKNYVTGFGYPKIEGLEITTDWPYLKEIRENIFVFSAAKTYQQIKETSELIAKYPDNFNEFKKAAKDILVNYNKNYLLTEYQTARSIGRSAVEWQRIQENKKLLPSLTYQTVGDLRVRPTHVELDNITRPVNDSFWNKYYPPNGWNCRCIAEQNDSTEITDLSNFNAPQDVPELFRTNFAKEKIVFKEDHPYFTVPKEDQDLALVNFNLPLPK